MECLRKPLDLNPQKTSNQWRDWSGEMMWSDLSFITGFLNLSTIDILGQIILRHGGGGCSAYCSMFCSIPVVYSLDARNIPLPQCDNQTLPNVAQRWEGGGGGNITSYRKPQFQRITPTQAGYFSSIKTKTGQLIFLYSHLEICSNSLTRLKFNLKYAFFACLYLIAISSYKVKTLSLSQFQSNSFQYQAGATEKSCL